MSEVVPSSVSADVMSTRLSDELSVIPTLVILRGRPSLPSFGVRTFAKVRTSKLGKDGRLLKITNVGITDSSSDNLVDMTSAELDEGETSDIDYNDGEGSRTNTLASSTSQKELRPPKKGSTAPSENNEAAGFGSDTSPRTDTGDNDELDQAEGN